MNRSDNPNAWDEPVEGDFNISFSSIPISSTVEVLLPPLWTAGKGSKDYFDEYGPRKYEIVQKQDLDDCFFCPNPNLFESRDDLVRTVLPPGFYGKEFLEIDPTNIPEFLIFQRKWGPVYGARERMPLGTKEIDRIRPEPSGAVFAGSNSEYFREQLRGIKASRELFDSVPDEEMVDDMIALRLGAVSFREAIFAVVDAQWAIRSCTRALRKDLGPMTRREVIEALAAVEYVSHFLSSAFPTISLVIGEPKPTVCDLITATFAQLARGLLNNEAYRTCHNPECARVFTPREMGRRQDTLYCCPECQERAKRLRHLAKKDSMR